MRKCRRFLCRLYGLLLNLFPKMYREEYGEELQTVFGLALDDAAKAGGLELIRVAWRELFSLPGAIFYEHLRERRKSKMIGKFTSALDFEQGSRNEMLAALAPFLLFGAIPTLIGWVGNFVKIPMWLQIVFAVFYWLCGLSLLAIGFAKRLPRWFLPYLGLPLPVFSVLIYNTVIDPNGRGIPILYQSSWFLRAFVYEGLIWAGLLLLIPLLVLVVRLIPKFRPFYSRLREDWTLFCFLLYGITPFGLVITFSEYKHEESYLLLSFLILAAGGGLYLRNDETLKKFLCLYLGMALSMSVAAAGKALLYASSFPVLHFTWQTEAISTIITWMWLALIMCLPFAINLLPHTGPSSKA